MIMSKKNILTFILYAVFILIFNALFFVNGGTHHAPHIWVVYGFTHLSYIAVLITPLIASKKSMAVLSKTTTYAISACYFLIVFFLGMATVAMRINKIKLVISLELFLFSLYLIILVANLIADDATETKQQQMESGNHFIKSVSHQLQYAQSLCSDKKAKSKIEQLYYLAHSSPIKGGYASQQYETEIMRNASLLERNAENASAEEIISICNEIEKLFYKRNHQI